MGKLEHRETIREKDEKIGSLDGEDRMFVLEKKEKRERKIDDLMKTLKRESKNLGQITVQVFYLNREKGVLTQTKKKKTKR